MLSKIKMPVKTKIKGHESISLNEKQRAKVIKKAAKVFGKYLTTLGYDWENDPHMADTPLRYTKAWVNELFAGNFKGDPNITSFKEEDEKLLYPGSVIQKEIKILSKCSHHLETFYGVAYIGYIPNENGEVIGLSKLNRIADYYARRPQVQERLTKQIHDAISAYIPGNRGVAVYLSCYHQCCSNRGIAHNSAMDTFYPSGVFLENPSVKQEFLFSINLKKP